ncbi:MAG: hypothetical protein EOP33_01095 [Rickettsiaceae bacterium]|nr:MAG: hypothetical protein EOP33_01095 [Rickettsiaceae bacterium]
MKPEEIRKEFQQLLSSVRPLLGESTEGKLNTDMNAVFNRIEIINQKPTIDSDTKELSNEINDRLSNLSNNKQLSKLIPKINQLVINAIDNDDAKQVLQSKIDQTEKDRQDIAKEAYRNSEAGRKEKFKEILSTYGIKEGNNLKLMNEAYKQASDIQFKSGYELQDSLAKINQSLAQLDLKKPADKELILAQTRSFFTEMYPNSEGISYHAVHAMKIAGKHQNHSDFVKESLNLELDGIIAVEQNSAMVRDNKTVITETNFKKPIIELLDVIARAEQSGDNKLIIEHLRENKYLKDSQDVLNQRNYNGRPLVEGGRYMRENTSMREFVLEACPGSMQSTIEQAFKVCEIENTISNCHSDLQQLKDDKVIKTLIGDKLSTELDKMIDDTKATKFQKDEPITLEESLAYRQDAAKSCITELEKLSKWAEEREKATNKNILTKISKLVSSHINVVKQSLGSSNSSTLQQAKKELNEAKQNVFGASDVIKNVKKVQQIVRQNTNKLQANIPKKDNHLR